MRLSLGCLCAVTACAAALTAAPARAQERGYDLWFAGTVVSVDVRHGRLKVQRGPMETAGPAIEECTIERSALEYLRSGMSIVAQADTSRHPWRVLHLRILVEREPHVRHLAAGGPA